jgi:hypothetical protein
MNAHEKKVVQEIVLRFLEDDYGRDFQPIFERAVQVSRGLVVEANDEIRVAHNHCAYALGRDASKKTLDKALFEIDRGRRHLQQAKYVCLVQMFSLQIRDATERVSKIGNKKSNGDVQGRLDALVETESTIAVLSVKQRFSREEIVADMAESVEVNKRLELLLTEVNQLIEHLDSNFPESASRQESRGSKSRSSGNGNGQAIDPSPENTGDPSSGSTTSVPKRARSVIGRAILGNRHQLLLSASALLLLIDEKIATLQGQNPNSHEAIQARDLEIAHYERFRKQLQTLRDDAAAFSEGSTKETNAVQSVKAYAEGIQSWWTKRYDQICERTFEMGLFMSAVGVCSLAGAGGWVSVAVSGALVGGKPVVDAIKSIAKSIPKVSPASE